MVSKSHYTTKLYHLSSLKWGYTQVHSLPRVETVTTTWGHGRKNEDFVCIYVVYNCIPSPVLCPLEKPNRKWYQSLTTPQNCIVSPLSNKAILKCTACLGSKLWLRLGVTVEKNEDFVCIYVVYNCIPSPVLCPLEKPNRKWYQSLTTPQNCIISPLSNEATLKCAVRLGSKL